MFKTQVGFMKNTLQPAMAGEALHVLLVGNNPIEMGSVLEKLNQVRAQRVVTEIAFDVQSILERLMRFRPHYILIDDNIGRLALRKTVDALSANKKTRDVPIMVLKNSNYRESLGATSILDYLLKQNLTAEALYRTLRNALRFRKTQMYLYQAYQKRKGLLSSFMS